MPTALHAALAARSSMGARLKPPPSLLAPPHTLFSRLHLPTEVFLRSQPNSPRRAANALRLPCPPCLPPMRAPAASPEGGPLKGARARARESHNTNHAPCAVATGLRQQGRVSTPHRVRGRRLWGRRIGQLRSVRQSPRGLLPQREWQELSQRMLQVQPLQQRAQWFLLRGQGDQSPHLRKLLGHAR